MKASISIVVVSSLLCLLSGCAAAKVRNTSMPADQMGLRYRIELIEEGKGSWEAIDRNRKIKRTEDVRFRFMSNMAGTLYVLNSSSPNASLQPVFGEGRGKGLRSYLGLGTHVGASEVGIFPDPSKGGGMRFTGGQGMEGFLMVFVPDHLGERGVMAVPAGAEGWNFEAKTTYMAIGKSNLILFHYLEMKSK